MSEDSPRPKAAVPARRGVRAPARRSDLLMVAGVGASAGGLDAFRTLVKGLAPSAAMAIILVQHLDPDHDSLLVELLTGYAPLPVREAADGLALEGGWIYVIPPGRYLAVESGVLRLTEPEAPRGARLPFDFLLQSLARGYGPRAVAVVLSGTGGDGALGVRAIKAAGGLVIVQDPEEAAYDGMPRSALATGVVDRVLPAAAIAAVLADYRPSMTTGARPVDDEPHGRFQGVIAYIRAKTPHNFQLYKPGTLARRIERRMTMAGIAIADAETYLRRLEASPEELENLTRDLLIHVTSFFRDPGVFDLLAAKTIPAIVAAHDAEQPIRVWVAGCSTGEEAYSLAMLFREAIVAAGGEHKLQIFASDVDAEAVATAREGLYPDVIASDVSAERLARFFTQEKAGYRASSELRSAVVFTVQDVLNDPPFSRMDMVSCRNLLIYLSPEAQAKVIALFHFALGDGGVLLLGKSETAGPLDGRFEAIAKPERLYRHLGRSRPGDFGFLIGGDDPTTPRMRSSKGLPPQQQAALADLCRRLLLASYTPAAALVTPKHECLYLLGATERYLRVPSGHPTHDILAMAPAALRSKLSTAIRQAQDAQGRISIDNCRIESHGHAVRFRIDVQPAQFGGETLLLVCFVEQAETAQSGRRAAARKTDPRVGELEHELEAAKTELRGAILDLELSGEEQMAIHEEALSANEEFQSTNEELLTSKEELQSLNEELTALNTQLQETLERQRTTADDLQNVLYSTDLATVFLDRELKIRFFTPATRFLFNVIATDVGRPLSDLNSLAADKTLTDDARRVLGGAPPVEKEIETGAGVWFVRRVLPYRTHDGGVEGVVITFTDVTLRKTTSRALEDAKSEAEQTNVAKSRFLAVASHDLRQPMQALALLQGLLARIVEGPRAQGLVARLDETLGAMSGMLNTLLDINQIESGTMKVERVSFPINDLLDRLRDELSYPAQARNLRLRVIPCSLTVDTDPRLLDQMVRNLLSNALKYTAFGKVLLGCRRRGGVLSIEVWDTGVGIAQNQLSAIFEEYHQVDNAARERNRGLGLGLSIVKRLGELLGHAVRVSSRPGRGSMFAIEVPRPESRPTPRLPEPGHAEHAADAVARTGSVLLVEDDPDIRDLLRQLLVDEGHRVAAAADGPAALALLAQERLRPDIILADFNLPVMTGLQVAARVRAALGVSAPVVILTGDISADTLRAIRMAGHAYLSKPVKAADLNRVMAELLPHRAEAAALDAPPTGAQTPVVYVVDDDETVREAIGLVIEDAGMAVEGHADAESFLAAYEPERPACLLIDAYLPGMDGLELLRTLADAGRRLPAIMITGRSDVAIAVEAMKRGACDFIEKPIGRTDLLAAVERALELDRDDSKAAGWRTAAQAQIDGLTARQKQVMAGILDGLPNKVIAFELGISQRTVENHRAAIMKRTGAASVPALARLAVAAV